MKKIITRLAIIFALYSNTANADLAFFDVGSFEDWTYTVAYNVFTTRHASNGFTNDEFGDEVEFNEDNDYIGFHVNFTNRFGAFAMKGINSYFEESYGAGVELFLPAPTWELGSDIGIASGYEDLLTFEILPFVNPFIRYNYQLTPMSKVSARFGSMNFMAENLLLEYTVNF